MFLSFIWFLTLNAHYCLDWKRIPQLYLYIRVSRSIHATSHLTWIYYQSSISNSVANHSNGKLSSECPVVLQWCFERTSLNLSWMVQLCRSCSSLSVSALERRNEAVISHEKMTFSTYNLLMIWKWLVDAVWYRPAVVWHKAQPSAWSCSLDQSWDLLRTCHDIKHEKATSFKSLYAQGLPNFYYQSPF